jgi:transposase-like protein
MTSKAKAKIGRPPEAVPEDKAEAICQWISLGQTLRQWCRENDVHYSTVYLWMEKDQEFAQRFARAREIGHDAIADETLEIIDTEAEFAESWSKDGGSKHRDSAHAGWLKNRAEQRMKLLAKWNPKKYGEKVGVEHSGAIALDAAILEARKRVNQPE